jgi:carbon monoxide dehydrogenase subunit G
MKIQIDRSYPLACTPEVAWEFLQNLEAVAGCMPGAKITERLDPNHYKGVVTARVGPATMSFRGEVQVEAVDPAARSLRLVGKGTDSTGSSGAGLSLTARIEPAAGDQCALVGASEISMSGKAAAFAGRMMSTVAEQVLQQFAQNFATQVSALQAQRAAPQAPLAGNAPAATAPAAGGADAPGAPSAARELNALSLAWGAFRNWLRRLFSRTAA